MSGPVEAALAVGTREDLVAYLAELADRARVGSVPVENPSTSAFIEASAAWLDGLDSFLRHHVGEGAPEAPSWATIALICTVGLTYE